MAKKPLKNRDEEDKLHIEVESWRWETTSKGLSWKQWLGIALLLAVAILFAFGFLVIAFVILIIGIIINIVYFLFKKIS